jgi:hypothetical protein
MAAEDKVPDSLSWDFSLTPFYTHTEVVSGGIYHTWEECSLC